MRQHNPISHYGGPLIGISLAFAALVGVVLALGGEDFRAFAAVWLAVLSIHWIIIVYLLWLAFDFRINSFSSPRVRSIRADEGLLIVSQRDWLGIAVAVLVYKQEGEFERLLCPGTVINVQQNGLVQIALTDTGPDESEVANVRAKLSDGETSTLIIKPGQAQER